MDTKKKSTSACTKLYQLLASRPTPTVHENHSTEHTKILGTCGVQLFPPVKVKINSLEEDTNAIVRAYAACMTGLHESPDGENQYVKPTLS